MLIFLSTLILVSALYCAITLHRIKNAIIAGSQTATSQAHSGDTDLLASQLGIIDSSVELMSHRLDAFVDDRKLEEILNRIMSEHTLTILKYVDSHFDGIKMRLDSIEMNQFILSKNTNHLSQQIGHLQCATDAVRRFGELVGALSIPRRTPTIEGETPKAT